MVLILQLALISPSAFKNDHKVSQMRETSMFLASKGSLYVFYSFLWPLSPRTHPFVFPLSPATVKQTASHLHTNNAALVMPMNASSMSSGYWFWDSSCVTKLLMPRPSHPRIQCHVWKRLTHSKFLQHAPSLSTHRSKGRHDAFTRQVCSRNIHPSAPASQT